MLAAGLARRMGRPKLVLSLEGKPIIRWSVEALLPHVERLIVVTGGEAAALRAALAGLTLDFAINSHPEAGQGSSIAVGVRALPPGTEAVIVALGDQPRTASGVVPALIERWRRTRKPIVAPVYRGVQGTPVLFAAAVFDELTALRGDAGARGVVGADPGRVERVAFDVAMPDDVDTPEDLARLHVE